MKFFSRGLENKQRTLTLRKFLKLGQEVKQHTLVGVSSGLSDGEDGLASLEMPGWRRGEAGELGREREAVRHRFCRFLLSLSSACSLLLPPLPLRRNGQANSQQLENSPPRAVSRIFLPF